MIAIIDYKMGNSGSILNMLGRIGVRAEITADPAILRSADKLILPGVGAFDAAMRSLEELGLKDVLNSLVLTGRKPILGVCLGMQLFSLGSEEGEKPGLGWVDAVTVRFGPETGGRPIPHMGWTHVEFSKASPFGEGLEDEARFYFVHSYHVRCRNAADVLGTARYGAAFHCALQRGNIAGVQFHPEKSHKYGMQLLKNFAAWTAA